MSLFHNPRIVTSGLNLALDVANTRSFRGEATTNLIPTPSLNTYPTIGNQWGTYNTNQYNNNQYFSIGIISSVSSNIITTTSTHPLRSYDVVTPQTTGGGVTAGVNYLVKRISDTQFSLHTHNSSQDGSQGYINLTTGNHKVYDNFANDVRISVNSTSFPTMWWGPPHLPNSGLVKEIITNGFTHPDTLVVTDCIRQHYIRTDDVKDGMAYNVDATVTPGQPVTVSFYHKPMDARAVGKSISYQIYNYTGGSAASFSTSFTIGPVGVWQRFTYTFTPTYGAMVSYWFSIPGGVYSWDMSNIQIEQKSSATAFVAGTRGTTVATGGGISDLSGNSNHGEVINNPTFSSNNSGSLVFDGVDDYILLPTNFFNHNSGTPFTVSMWFKTSLARGVLFGQQDTITPNNAVGYTPAIYIDTNGKIRTSCFWGNFLSNQSVSTASVNDNVWHNIAVTFASGSHKSYLDGQLFDTLAKTQTVYSSSYYYFIGTGRTIGWSTADANPYFSGSISTFTFYTTELTSQNILQNFNASRKRFGV